MLNCSASLAMSTSVLKTWPGKLDIKRHSPSILYLYILSKTSMWYSEVYNFATQHVYVMRVLMHIGDMTKMSRYMQLVFV